MRRRHFLKVLLGAPVVAIPMAPTLLGVRRVEPSEGPLVLNQTKHLPPGALRSDVPDVLNNHAEQIEAIIQKLNVGVTPPPGDTAEARER